jgi:hypothetical protein
LGYLAISYILLAVAILLLDVSKLAMVEEGHARRLTVDAGTRRKSLARV